jgi:putative Mn2+ efflux pump MntP
VNEPGIVEVAVIAVGLAMDAFAVSLAARASGRARGRRAAFRLSFHFGLFQFLMPVLGWFAGYRVEPLVSAVDHWIALAMLAFVGARMIHGGLSEQEPVCGDPSRGWTLVALSLATSIDALAIGFSLAMLRAPVWVPALVIGVTAAALSLGGIWLGRRAGPLLGRGAAVAGGILLIFIGLKIVLDHVVLA